MCQFSGIEEVIAREWLFAFKMARKNMEGQKVAVLKARSGF